MSQIYEWSTKYSGKLIRIFYYSNKKLNVCFHFMHFHFPFSKEAESRYESLEEKEIQFKQTIF